VTPRYTYIDAGWDGDTTLNPGEGGLYTSPIATQLTFCGAVLQGRLTNTLPMGMGFVMRAHMVPVSGSISSALALPAEANDIL